MQSNHHHSVCVYCASSTRIDKVYKDAARQLGSLLAARGSEVICGGGNEGLMRSLADGALDAGGNVTGVIPRFMIVKGWAYERLARLVATDDIHSRKKRMIAGADDVMALPGGCGTLEELLEVITWKQLGLFAGRIIIVNINNYYSPLLKMLDQAVDHGFMKPSHRRLWLTANTVEQAVEMLDAENPKAEPKR